jgi:hypothetical protein
MLFVLLVRAGLWLGVSRGRDLILDSAPILAWRRADPDAAFGHAPAHHPRPLLLGYRLHALLCRGTGLPLLFLLSPATVHDAPFARPLLELAVRLFGLRPRVVRLDAAYWGPYADHLDPHGVARRSRHPLESQAPAAARWLAADLDRRGVGPTQQLPAGASRSPGSSPPRSAHKRQVVGECRPTVEGRRPNMGRVSA